MEDTVTLFSRAQKELLVCFNSILDALALDASPELEVLVEDLSEKHKIYTQYLKEVCGNQDERVVRLVEDLNRWVKHTAACCVERARDRSIHLNLNL